MKDRYFGLRKILIPTLTGAMIVTQSTFASANAVSRVNMLDTGTSHGLVFGATNNSTDINGFNDYVSLIKGQWSESVSI